MVAKMGEVKQHHFAHMNLMNCTPEAVAQTVAGIWLADALREYLTDQRPLIVEWRAQAGESHRVDLLAGIAWIDHNTFLDTPQGNILLLDGGGEARAVIKLGKTSSEEITTWARDGVTVVVLNPVDVTSGRYDLPGLMAAASIFGGWWLGDQTDMPRDLITDPGALRQVLTDAVARPPFVFCGDLPTEGPNAFVLEVHDKRLWLPPEMWRDVVGGTFNRIGRGVEVTIQEWDIPGGRLGLFYVVVNQTYAVGLRAYPKGETLSVKLGDAAFRRTKTTALDVARQLVGISALIY
jgi:hypothetical protein